MNPSGDGRKGWPSWEGPKWLSWVAVALAVGVLSIAIQEMRDDDPGEAFTWALLGLVVGGRGIWTLWRERSSPDKSGGE
jgi:hypothetical protein